MQIKQAKMDDLNQIMEILRDGRNQLAEQGIDQWQGDYPNEEHIKEDIEKGRTKKATEVIKELRRKYGF